jgi:hypothetical protein
MSLVGLAAYAFWFYGVERSDLVLAAVAAVGLAVAIGAGVAVAGLALGLRVASRWWPAGPPIEVETGRPYVTGFTRLHPWFLPWVSVDWTWVEPEAEVRIDRAWGRLEEIVTLRRRGEYDAVVRRLEIGDPLGLCRVAFRVAEERAVRAVPGTGRLDRVPTVHGLAAGDHLPHPEAPAVGDRLDLRRYAPGDPVRHVVWKVYARTRDLVVRQPERAFAPSHQTVAYLVVGQEDDATAGAARVATRSGVLGGQWSFGADGVDAIAENTADALEVIVRSGRTAAERGGRGLGPFLDRVAQNGVRAVVFVPATPGPWVEAACAAASTRAASIEWMVCTDAATLRPPAVWRRWLLEPPSSSVPALEPVCTALAGFGSRVQVIDRSSGRVIAADALRRGR